MEHWAVYDENGECVGVDIEAPTEALALAQFVYAMPDWFAVVQDAATREYDLAGRIAP